MSRRRQTQNLTDELLLTIPREFRARVWRRNVGSGVPFAVVRTAVRLLSSGLIEKAIKFLRGQRIVRFGIAGEADIDGIIDIRGFGVRLCVEVKTGPDKQSKEQKSFQAMILRHGGIYIVARDADTAIEDLRSICAQMLTQIETRN